MVVGGVGSLMVYAAEGGVDVDPAKAAGRC